MVFFVSMDACKCHCARGDSIAGGGSCVVVVAVSGGYFRVPAVFCKDGIMPAKGVGVVPASKPCTHALSHAVHNAAGMRKTSLRKCKSRTPHLGLPVAPAMQSICHSKCFGRTSACKRPALCSTTSLTPETTNTWRRRTTHGKGSLVSGSPSSSLLYKRKTARLIVQTRLLSTLGRGAARQRRLASRPATGLVRNVSLRYESLTTSPEFVGSPAP